MTKNTYFTSLCFVFYMYMYICIYLTLRTTFPLSFNNKYLKYSQEDKKMLLFLRVFPWRIMLGIQMSISVFQ